MIEFDSPDKFIGTTAALILGGLAAGGAVASSEIAGHAATDAAKTQSTAATQAADYSAGQSAKAFDYINSLRASAKPGTAGSSAYSTLQRLTGGTPTPSPSFGSPATAAYPTLFGGAGPTGGTVMMRSPDGSTTQAVPAALVDHYRQRGAQVVAPGGNGGPGASKGFY